MSDLPKAHVSAPEANPLLIEYRSIQIKARASQEAGKWGKMRDFTEFLRWRMMQIQAELFPKPEPKPPKLTRQQRRKQKRK